MRGFECTRERLIENGREGVRKTERIGQGLVKSVSLYYAKQVQKGPP